MTTIPDQRDGIEASEKIDGYLTRSCLSSRSPHVVPLTGDASDRRYFRVLLPDSGSIVLSLHAAPFEFEKLPFVNVARLLASMPVPIRISGRNRTTAISRMYLPLKARSRRKSPIRSRQNFHRPKPASSRLRQQRTQLPTTSF